MTSFGVKVYRLLLSLLPGSFREEFGAESLELFDRLVREAKAERGRAAAARVVLGGWAGVVRAAVGARLEGATPGVTGAGTRAFGRGLSADLKQVPRGFRRRLGSCLTVLATVALAVGSTTAVFSVVDGVLLRPLPYPDSERLVRVWQTYSEWENSPNSVLRAIANGFGPPAPIYFDWVSADVGFEALGAYRDAPIVAQSRDGAEVLRGQHATSGLFEVLGVRPILGRTLAPADDALDSPPVAVVSETFWRNRFNGRTDVIGAELNLDGLPPVVVGVMPSGFQAPTENLSDVTLPAGLPQRTHRARSRGSRSGRASGVGVYRRASGLCPRDPNPA